VAQDRRPNQPLKPRPIGAGAKKQKARSEARHGFLKSFDGTRLFYSIEGSSGPPLIFCYGLVCSSLHWTYQIDYFSKNYKSVWFDYRGHQNSESPANLKTITIENMAFDLGFLLEELGIEDAVFLGHSMGVNIILELFRQQPKKIKAMVLANGTARNPIETMYGINLVQGGVKIFRYLHKMFPKVTKLIWESQQQNALSRNIVSYGGFNPHLTPKEDINLYLKQVSDMDPGVFLQLLETYDEYDATSWIHNIDVPTLILAGEKDQIIPYKQQELMHQLIPNSELEIIRHGSHCPQMDLPEQVNQRIEIFLKTVYNS